MSNRSFLVIIWCVLSQIFYSCDGNRKEHENVNQEIYLFPKRGRMLNDFENIFNAHEKDYLENILLDIQDKKNKNIIIATVLSYQPYTDFQKFTIDLGNRWNLDSNTILIVLNKEGRKVGVSITKDTSGISDKEVQIIISEVVLPEFKRSNYYKGIKDGILEITSKWK